MERVLVSWIGGHDIKAALEESEQQGPIASVLAAEPFDRVELLYNYDPQKEDVDGYLKWLQQKTKSQINARRVELSSPIAYGEIYPASEGVLEEISDFSGLVDLNILLSPGTPAMQAVWVLLAKTNYPATLWQSSPEAGVQVADIPIQIAAEYVPALKGVSAKTIHKLAGGEVPADASFDEIITKNPHMIALKAQAGVLASTDAPVLIYGESGTGKELFAKAIHNASARGDHEIVPINCGAIPKELMDSTLFGHKKGAFTGASSDKKGVFELADGSTLFLDEFGELEPDTQVRLLRVLNDGTFTPVGSDTEKRVDVRIIAATNKDLMSCVAEGSFREDLFFRVAVGVLHLPPIRERQGDLLLLTDCLLAALQKKENGLKSKKISVEGKNIILRHGWSGNIRELSSTLFRAALWSQSDIISAEDIKKALFQMPEKNTGVLGRNISQGIDINNVISEVAAHYIERALAETGGVKSKAAELLGLKSQQVLTKWMEKHGVEK